MFSLRMASGAAQRASATRYVVQKAQELNRRTNNSTYATLREIEIRLKSIKNIEKITKTMMVVASTRVNKAARAMQSSRVYGEAAKDVYDEAEVQAPEATETPEKNLYVVMSSDKGLCGSIHSQLARAARRYLAEDTNADIVVVGDKQKAQLSRSNAKQIKLSFAGIGKEAPTFNEAALVADEISKLGVKYDNIKILYNKYVSTVAFEPTIIEAPPASTIEQAPKFGTYELEADDVTENLAEFNLANFILWGLSEGHAAEITARRNAMDNASKNANDMIGKYSILYNRTRQAVITNELVDIITGASSLE